MDCMNWRYDMSLKCWTDGLLLCTRPVLMYLGMNFIDRGHGEVSFIRKLTLGKKKKQGSEKSAALKIHSSHLPCHMHLMIQIISLLHLRSYPCRAGPGNHQAQYLPTGWPDNFNSLKWEIENPFFNMSAEVFSHAWPLPVPLWPTPEQLWHSCEAPRRSVDLPQPFDVSAVRWRHTSVQYWNVMQWR